MVRKINDKESLEKLPTLIRSDIVHMTYLANSGHPGGPLGFVEAFLEAFQRLNLNPNNPHDTSCDKYVASAGHYSALVYSTISHLFFPDKHDLIVSKFRSLDDVIEGHVTHHFPYIWDSTGHLGYGPSIAAGHAIADRHLGYNDTRILCTMGDGEQTKGAIPEALRFIRKFNLSNISILIDCNDQQLSGTPEEIMPMDIAANYKSNGWNAVEVDGYDMEKMIDALDNIEPYTAIHAKTVMGKGVKEAEDTHKFHGMPVTDLEKAVKDLGVTNRLEEYQEIRESDMTTGFKPLPIVMPRINPGKRIVYNEDTACRNAWGKALVDIADINLEPDGKPKAGQSPIVVFDCDLAGSVKTEEFAKKYPGNFYQGGVQENSTAMIAGTVSTRGVLTWTAMFGAFGHSMCFNEHMLTAINEGNQKLITTHNSIDVGEDSKTHSPTGYLSLENHPGWVTFVPVDANQTDAIVRYMPTAYGNKHLALGRSKIPIITKQGSDEPFFDDDYRFNPELNGFDVLRDYGDDYAIVTYGTPAHRAVRASEKLHEMGIHGKVLNVPIPGRIPSQIRDELTKPQTIVTFEDHYVETGIRDRLNTVIRTLDDSSKKNVINIGMTGYSKSAPSEELCSHFGIHEDNLFRQILLNYRTEVPFF